MVWLGNTTAAGLEVINRELLKNPGTVLARTTVSCCLSAYRCRVAVWMPLQRQLIVGLLYVSLQKHKGTVREFATALPVKSMQLRRTWLADLSRPSICSNTAEGCQPEHMDGTVEGVSSI